MSTVIIEGQLTATGATSPLPVSDSAIPSRNININIAGTFSASIDVERSFDNGLSWNKVSKNADGATATYTAPCSLQAMETEIGVAYRLNCTSYTSGTILYRLSR